jgi:hypothetical protein
LIFAGTYANIFHLQFIRALGRTHMADHRYGRLAGRSIKKSRRDRSLRLFGVLSLPGG